VDVLSRSRRICSDGLPATQEHSSFSKKKKKKIKTKKRKQKTILKRKQKTQKVNK
jgi:hypothetical protein